MTPPTKLVVGRWIWSGVHGGRSRSLRYGSDAHGYKVEATELQGGPGNKYSVRLADGCVSPRFDFSYQAHGWFMETAQRIVREDMNP